MGAKVCFIASFLPLAVLIGSCGKTYRKQACRLDREFVIAKTKRAPTAVAVTPGKEGVFAVAWSADGNVFVARVSPERGVRGQPARVEQLGPELAGLETDEDTRSGPKTFWPARERLSIGAEDIDVLVVDEQRSAVASLVPATQSRQGGAYLSILSGEDGDPSVTLRLGAAYEYAHRISVADFDGSLYVAWHEGRLNRSDVVLSRVDPDTLAIEGTRRIASDDAAIASPSLVSTKGGVMVAWTETERTVNSPSTIVHLAQLDRNLKLSQRRTVAKASFVDPAPALVYVENRVGVVFRDDKDGDDTQEYYFSLFDLNGEKARVTKRISQADGWRGPCVTAMPPYLFGAAVRSFQRNLLIGLNRFDLRGSKLGGEFQLYADKTQFVRVDIAATAENTMMVYAEDGQGIGRVLAGCIVCRSPDEKSAPGQ